ncbi:hypothetical protein C1646_819807 [Rhizophagus diaphanus]|nr:hypothetical protein C1646_819807 [Rhizophagus diaphanus] [Rhizophagus sp. MUCL 43196]
MSLKSMFIDEKNNAIIKNNNTISTTSITSFSRPNDTDKLTLIEERLKFCADETNTFSFEKKPIIAADIESSNTISTTSIPSSFASDLEKLNFTEERLKRYVDETENLSSVTTITSNTEVTFLREKAISKTLNNIKLSMKVDLCFVLDCTGSMRRHIAAARDCILQVTNYVKHTNPNFELRVGFCGYRDHNDKTRRLKLLEFTDQYEQFTKYMKSVSAFSSLIKDDLPEDVLGGLNAAITQLDWKSSTRVLLHIGDYPPHGRRFSNIRDKYPNGDPYGLTAESVLKMMQSKNILYFFGRITSHTDTMLQIFHNIIGEFPVFDLVGGDPIKLIEKFIKATSSSITYAVSLTSTIGSSSKDIYSLQRKKLDMNPNEPNWNILPLQEGVVMWYHNLNTLEELKDPNYFNKSNLFSKSFSFKIASQPFSAGVEKYAYFALDMPTKKMVMKEYLHVGQGDLFEKYLEAIEISTIASFLSTEFNLIAKQNNISKVNFLNVKLLRCGTIDFCTRYYTIEPRLQNTEYKRFNTNTGVITELRPTLEAFVHFTYEYTKGYLVICDLQGIELYDEFLLTDPAIHCINSLRFGSTNFGKEGIKQLFLTNHRCNDICKKLKLNCINNGLSADGAAVARVFCHDYPNNPYIDALYSMEMFIQDGYIIETEAANKAIRCETKYIPVNKVLYTITWKEGWAEYSISSERSASGAINAFLKRINRENSRLSGIHVFGLDIEKLHQARTGELTITKTTNIDKKLILQHRMISESREPIHLRNMELEFEDHIINIKYNLLLDHIKLDAYVRACDEALLGRDGYRRLAAVEARLTCEYQVNQLDDDDEHQSNPDGIMVDEQEIGNGVYRSIRNLLQIFIPIWNESNPPILQPGDTINLKLGGDGKEKYETLAKVENLFKYQLQDLQENGISVDASNHWNVDLCWPINKNTKCQKKPPLFPAIKQENYVPDELHLLLCISDVLMECFFNDLFKKKESEREIKNQIEQTMKSIKVHFEFFKSRSNSGKWDWTSLMGPDKKKVLQYFPIVNFISGKRSEEIQKLWHDFYDLYLVLRSPNLTYSEIDNFENKVKQWIKLFCRPSQGQINSASQIPGLYRKEDVTPYMHVFSQHIPEFL